MEGGRLLDIAYEEHGNVNELIDAIIFCLEEISLTFQHWDEPYVEGPGLYVAVVSGRSVASYAVPMGDNRWPVTECRSVLGNLDEFCETARKVAITRDGGVVVSVDGIVQEQMVRFDDRSADVRETDGLVEYADWMGSRHMSAADTSAREEVIMTVTLSAENGRVTRFTDGAFETFHRDEFAREWQSEDDANGER